MAEFNRFDSFCEQTKDIRNWSDTKIADEMLQPTLITILLVKAFIPVVFVIGSFGNIAFFLLIARVKTMRTTTNFYLANLAAADLITLSVVSIIQLWRFVDFKQVVSWPFYTNFGCGFYSFTIHFSSLSSILLITIVSFDRYFAICHPLKYHITKVKKKGSFMITFFAWIISAVLSLFRALAFGKLVHECILWPSHEKYKHFPETIKQCKTIHPFLREDILEHVVHTVPFITAFVTNTIINIRIVQKLARPPPGENRNQQKYQIKRRITWMLLINSIVYFLSLAPKVFLLMFGTLMDLSHRKQMYYKNTVFIFIMLNSAINPILYGIVSPTYRKGFLKVFYFARN